MTAARIEKQIGYRFQSPSLLEEALRHGSAQGRKEGQPSNERLEFLGDAVLNLCVAYYIYNMLPQAEEGVLTKARASIINNQNLLKIGERIGVAESLNTDSSVRRKGGGITRKMIANAVEAIIGAIFIDGGYDACFSFVRDQFQFDGFLNAMMDGFDAKSQLQEWCQKEKIALPEYSLLSTEGLPHERMFRARAQIMKWFAEGAGKSKKEAETSAAAKLLKILAVSKEETS
ncbi:MAG: ribonuclease III [Syntrophorhabdaceae bacterium]|nr:ribonuclease III [Syntrophorhabdaceae bacterium]